MKYTRPSRSGFLTLKVTSSHVSHCAPNRVILAVPPADFARDVRNSYLALGVDVGDEEADVPLVHVGAVLDVGEGTVDVLREHACSERYRHHP